MFKCFGIGCSSSAKNNVNNRARTPPVVNNSKKIQANINNLQRQHNEEMRQLLQQQEELRQAQQVQQKPQPNLKNGETIVNLNNSILRSKTRFDDWITKHQSKFKPNSMNKYVSNMKQYYLPLPKLNLSIDQVGLSLWKIKHASNFKYHGININNYVNKKKENAKNNHKKTYVNQNQLNYLRKK